MVLAKEQAASHRDFACLRGRNAPFDPQVVHRAEHVAHRAISLT
jgi:hypothetical protein